MDPLGGGVGAGGSRAASRAAGRVALFAYLLAAREAISPHWSGRILKDSCSYDHGILLHVVKVSGIRRK